MWAIQSKIAPENNRITITENDFKKIKQCKKNLIHALFIEEKFDIVVENYKEVEVELLTIAINSQVHNIEYIAEYNMRYNKIRNVNRKFSNFLSSCRLYQDQTKHELKEIFGPNSDKLSTFKKFLSEEYDNNKEYRLFEFLRNYSQHEGMLVRDFSTASMITSHDKPSQIAFCVTPQAIKDHLVNSSNLKAQVTIDLREKPDAKIDLKEGFRIYFESITRAHSKLRDMMTPENKNWRKQLEHYISAWQQGRDFSHPLATVFIDDNGDLLESDDLFLDFDDLRKTLENKNCINERISRCYATSQNVGPLTNTSKSALNQYFDRIK